MKTAARMAAQGDVLFRRIDSLPLGAKPEPRDGPIVVAHSETGHHHVIASETVELYTSDDPMVSFLRLDSVFADVEHQRPLHTHETVRLLGREEGPTYSEVRCQREHVFPPPLERDKSEKNTNWRRVDD